MGGLFEFWQRPGRESDVTSENVPTTIALETSSGKHPTQRIYQCRVTAGMTFETVLVETGNVETRPSFLSDYFNPRCEFCLRHNLI